MFGPISICPFDPDYVEKHRKLPSICTKCFKALIFDFSIDQKLVVMLNSLAKDGFHGKFNEGVVVFYIRGKNYADGREKLLKFLPILEEQMRNFGIEGRVQWRVSCKEYQRVVPELFKSAKELSELAFSQRRLL